MRIDYLSWNNLIVSYFFKKEMAGQRVYLYVTEDLLNYLGQPRGADFQDFLEAVKQGPGWATRQGICQKALQSMDVWQYKRRGYPPYIGYLALFVLAAGLDGDFASRSYYPRLRTLLNEPPDTGQYPSFNKMLELWKDLERWSSIDQSGQLGFFNVDAAESWIHVGLPVSQTLLIEAERQVLSRIFVEAGLDATSPPSKPRLASLLLYYGKANLRRRTLQLLSTEENGGEQELREALLGMILEELQNWDGTFSSFEQSSKKENYGTLRLCCRIDRIAQRISLTLRCKTAHDFPEDGLLFRFKNNSESFSCEEEAMGWSSELIRDSDGMKVDATQLNWLEGIDLHSSEERWAVKLPGSVIRIFTNGAEEGLPNFVEVNQLPKNSPFYLIVNEAYRAEVEQWGAGSCTEFNKVEIKNELPNGWFLFYAKSVFSDEYIGKIHPILALSKKPRIDFKKGIRFSKGHEFFAFAPPKILVEDIQGDFQVSCNGSPLLSDEQARIYTLPPNMPTDKVVVIEVHQGNKLMCKRSLVLKANFSRIHQSTNSRFDCFGHILSGDQASKSGVAGVIVDGINVPPCPYCIPLSAVGERRIFLVGKEPGQIVSFPSEPLPQEWKPIWAISMSREGRAVFCGTSLSESQPIPLNSQQKTYDRRKLNEWKEILWHRRRRITPPQRSSLQRLWREFQKEARYV